MLITVGGPRDYRNFFFNLDVLLDGVKMERVAEADDEAGYILRYARDENGKSIITEAGRFKLERLEGHVVFAGTRRFSPDDAKAAAESKRERRRARNLRQANRAEVRGFVEGGSR